MQVFLLFIVIGFGVGFVGTHFQLPFWSQMLIIVGFLLLWFLYRNLQLAKKMQNPLIDEMEEQQMHEIFKKFPQEIIDFSTNNFVFYDKFTLDLGISDVEIFIFKHKEDELFYYTYYYPKLKRTSTMLVTIFSNEQTLTTTNTSYLKNHTNLEDDYYQYFSEKSDSELLEIHKEGVLYLKAERGIEIASFPNPNEHREFFRSCQIKSMENLGYFPLWHFYKATITNNMSKYSKPIATQLERSDR